MAQVFPREMPRLSGTTSCDYECDDAVMKITGEAGSWRRCQRVKDPIPKVQGPILAQAEKGKIRSHSPFSYALAHS